MASTVRGYGATTDRSRGWLRYMHRKATTPDSWDRDGRPHPHWDGVSGEPRRSWHRFDLQDSAQAVAVMADVTPAWREVYGTILDELVARFTGYWAAKDWLDQIGDDPRREQYPEDWYETLIPPTLRGKYDVPGWTANGVEPWGLQMDPSGPTATSSSAASSSSTWACISTSPPTRSGTSRSTSCATGRTRSPGRTPASRSSSPASGPAAPRGATARTPRSGRCEWPPRASV